MKKETYKRLLMDVTEFEIEDVITTTGEIDPTEDLSFDPKAEGPYTGFIPNM